MLKPLRPQKPTLIKNKSQYQLYEDDLTNYKSKSKSNLQQWNLLSSHILTNSPAKSPRPLHNPIQLPQLQLHNQQPAQQQQAQQQQQLAQHTQPSHRVQSTTPEHSMTGSSGIRNGKSSRLHDRDRDGDGFKADEKFGNICVIVGEKVRRQFESVEYEQKGTQDLLNQMRNMRQMLQQLNTLVTTKLSKYQLSYSSPKGMQVQTSPQKQPQLLQKRLQLNTSILQSLQKQKQQLLCRDKQLQQKDYLIQLQQLVNSAVVDIRSRKKQKHCSHVVVEKMDSKLVEMKELEDDDQYRMVKILKHNILYYFKKYHENRSKLQALDAKIGQLQQKQKDISSVYTKAVKIAEQKNLLVKANPLYIENKKKTDQLSSKLQQTHKKIQITKKSKQLQTQKLQKQIQQYKKQTQNCQQRIQQLSIQVTQYTNITNQNIEKYQISGKMLNKISYKFAEALLKDSNGNTNYTGSSLMQEAEGGTKGHILLKPKNKYNLNKSITTSAQNSALPSGRYSTLDNSNLHSPPETELKQSKQNDKNIQTIQIMQNKSKEFRIKPSFNLNLKKRSGENRSRLGDLSLDTRDQVVEKDNNKDEINYKPKRFQKIISQRKDTGV